MMAGPITWRTVMGQSLAEAGRPLEAAQRSISGALTGLGALITDQQQINQNVVDREREANVQSFLERLQSAGSVEDVEKLKASGELDTLRASLMPKDLARVRGAEDARAAALMQQTVAQRAFASGEAAAKAAPIKDQILASYLSGDPAQQAKAKQLLEANPGIPGMAELVKTMADFDAQKQQRDFVAKMNPLKIQEAQGNIAAANANREAAVEQRNAARLAQESALEQAKIERDRQIMRDSGNLYSEGQWTPGDAAELSEALGKAGIKDFDTKAAIIEAVSKNATQKLEYIGADGKKTSVDVPIPKRVAFEAALGADGGYFFNTDGRFGYAGDVAKNIRKAMQQTREVQLDNGKTAKVPSAVYDLKKFEEILSRRAASAPLVSSGKSR